MVSEVDDHLLYLCLSGTGFFRLMILDEGLWYSTLINYLILNCCGLAMRRGLRAALRN